MQSVAKFLAASLLFAPLLYAALQDYRSMRIPNWISIAIASGFFLYAGTHWFHVNFSMHILIAVVLFVVTYSFWMLGWLGGGDVKILTAVGLWLGPVYSLPFIVLLAVFSGVLSIGLLIVKRMTDDTDLNTYAETVRRIVQISRTGACPYAIPICLAAFATLPALFV